MALHSRGGSGNHKQFGCYTKHDTMTLAIACDDDNTGSGQAVNWLEAKKAYKS